MLDNTADNGVHTCNGSEQQLVIPGGARAVALKAFASNVAAVTIGVVGKSGAANGYPLDPGEPISLELLNPNILRVTGTLNDKVAWIITAA